MDRFFALTPNSLLSWQLGPNTCKTGPQRLSVFQYDANMLLEMGGTIMSLTVTLPEGLESVSDDAVADIVKHCKSVNDMGVSVLLRFAHEMNGECCLFQWRTFTLVTDTGV